MVYRVNYGPFRADIELPFFDLSCQNSVKMISKDNFYSKSICSHYGNSYY
jgi:hypothetical protein